MTEAGDAGTAASELSTGSTISISGSGSWAAVVEDKGATGVSPTRSGPETGVGSPGA